VKFQNTLLYDGRGDRGHTYYTPPPPPRGGCLITGGGYNLHPLSDHGAGYFQEAGYVGAVY
jgi:hypothetical protein